MKTNYFDLIQSDNWQDRIRGEYLELEDRINKLTKMLEKYSFNTLQFKPNCSLELFTSQLNAMTSYLNILKLRLNIENIVLCPES